MLSMLSPYLPGSFRSVLVSQHSALELISCMGLRLRVRLAKILHDHDVGLVEFVLSEKKRFAIRREC
jgi:hypothetical protein